MEKNAELDGEASALRKIGQSRHYDERRFKFRAPNHRNLLVEALYLFSKDTVQPFDAVA